MLTKKHYKAIAEIIETFTDEFNDEPYNHYKIVPRNRLVFALADYFEQDNPKFDRERFMKACGLG